MDDEGAIITTKFNRISLRLNQEYDIVKDLITIGANVGLAKTKSKDTSSLPRFDFIIQADPFTPVINPLVDSSLFQIMNIISMLLTSLRSIRIRLHILIYLIVIQVI